jgi:hypothetical protein
MVEIIICKSTVLEPPCNDNVFFLKIWPMIKKMRSFKTERIQRKETEEKKMQTEVEAKFVYVWYLRRNLFGEHFKVCKNGLEAVPIF